eukprot:4014709-Prymnesium_polylepis.2
MSAAIVGVARFAHAVPIELVPGDVADRFERHCVLCAAAVQCGSGILVKIAARAPENLALHTNRDAVVGLVNSRGAETAFATDDLGVLTTAAAEVEAELAKLKLSCAVRRVAGCAVERVELRTRSSRLRG